MRTLDISKRLAGGKFILVVNGKGEWRVYRIREAPRTSYMVQIDLSYQGPGTTEWTIHYGRPREPNQTVAIQDIVGIYESAEEATEMAPALESGRLALKDAHDRFRVLLALLGNV